MRIIKLSVNKATYAIAIFGIAGKTRYAVKRLKF